MSMLQTIESLGGERVLGAVASSVAFIEMIEQGLPTQTIDQLARLGDLSESDLAEIIPRRTLQHARAKGRLSAEQSDRVVRAAKVFTLAHRSFGSPEKATRWMKRRKRALGGRTPLSMLRTGSGAMLVEAMLDRIAFGIYA